jgi:DNA-binding LytR/AlgR family response regulator
MSEIRVAVCDDEDIYADKIAKITACFFETCNIDFHIEKFSSGGNLLLYNRTAKFDLILLDIDMPDISGIESAEKIRSINEDIPIVFITNLDNFVFEAIKFAPFRFIRKKFLAEEMAEMLAAFRLKFSNNSVYLDVFDENERNFRLRAIEIVYFESFGHSIVIHHPKGVFSAKTTMNELEKEYKHLGFLRIHKSFLVNFRYIYEIADGCAVLDDKTKLTISRYRQKDTRNEFLSRTRGEI